MFISKILKFSLSIIGAFALFCILSAHAHAATFTVDSTGDESAVDPAVACTTAGATCTLRSSIEAANSQSGADIINFGIVGAGVHTISPATTLPDITEQITIDGSTQSGANCGTLTPTDLPTSSNTPHTLQIEIDNSSNLVFSALTLATGSSSSIIRGLVIGNVPGSYGIDLTVNGISNVVIECNYIGTNAAGTAAAPIAGSAINDSGGNTDLTIQNNLISGSSQAATVASSTIRNNLIGTNAAGTAAIANNSGISVSNSGSTVLQHNVVAGNSGIGINIYGGSGSSITGNLVGVGLTGGALGNGGDGVVLFSANDFVIGGATAAARNIIAANVGDGIHIYNNCNGGVVSSNSTTYNNYIGTNADGIVEPGYGNGASGIEVNEYYGGCVSVYNHRIGGDGAGQPNIIAGNTNQGILIHQSSGFDVFSISVIGNSIFANGQFGIDLAADSDGSTGVADTDLGPNALNNLLMSYPTTVANYYINRPTINSTVINGSQVTVNYSLQTNQADNSTLSQSNVVGYRLDFYLNDGTQDGAFAGYSQGKNHLGSFIVNGSEANSTHTFASTITPTTSMNITATTTVLWATPGPPYGP